MKKSPFNSSCHYDYSNKCDCSEDDKCGCTYPNNMHHSYSEECFETKSYKNNEEEIIFINPSKQEENSSPLHIDEEWKNTIPYKNPSSHSYPSDN
jgi:hypothetical protein